jgi:hypothetical protein
MTLKVAFENLKSGYLPTQEERGHTFFMKLVQNAILKVMDGFLAHISVEFELWEEDLPKIAIS